MSSLARVPVNPWLIAVILLAMAGGAFWLLSSISGALLSAWLLAYLLAPLVMMLEERGVARGRACMLVYSLALLALAAIFVFVLPLLLEQVSHLAQNFPKVLADFQQKWWPEIASQFGLPEQVEASGFLSWLAGQFSQAEVSELSPWALWGASAVSGFLGAIVAAINVFLVPLIAYYLLRDWTGIAGAIRQRVPSAIRDDTLKLTRQADEKISLFLRGQLSVCLILSCLYGLGLYLVGLPYAFAIGLLAGLFSFLPYVGLVLGLCCAVVVELWAFGFGDHIWMVAIVFVLVQFAESFLLTPKLLGDKLGLHPVIILLALLVAGAKFGFAGMLLAIPVTAAGSVLIRELDRRYLGSRFLTSP